MIFLSENFKWSLSGWVIAELSCVYLENCKIFIVLVALNFECVG